jgi:ABC-2 type transport system permease protein
MSHRANQLKAALTIARYSLLATLRSPTSIVFSLLFPLIFITVFGSINVGEPPALKLAVAAGTDTTSLIYKSFEKIPKLKLVTGLSEADQVEQLRKGKITAVLNITADHIFTLTPHYNIHLEASGASGENLNLLETELNAAISKIDKKVFPQNASIAFLQVTKIPERVYRNIDFILPGQLGFSLLMAGVYGSSFLLFSLRQNMVLKRLRCAPVKRRAIIAGEMLSRLFFHILSFLVMVAIGYFIFKFTLINGAVTLIEMLTFSLFGLSIFMGIGFIISGLVQNENSITPISNTVVLPQILLCGLFFPINNYPHWMEQFCSALPLTLFVDGLRKIAFEGTHIWQMPLTVGGLLLWTLVIVPLSIRSFKWE